MSDKQRKNAQVKRGLKTIMSEMTEQLQLNEELYEENEGQINELAEDISKTVEAVKLVDENAALFKRSQDIEVALTWLGQQL